MSGAGADTAGSANSAVLRVRTGPLAGPLLARMVAMMLARAQCPVDRLDDAMLICDALGAHAGEHAADGHVEFTVQTRSSGMELRVGALAAGGAVRLAKATSLPGVGDVLEPIADEIRIESSAGGEDDELVLKLGFARDRLDADQSRTSPGGTPGPVLQRLADQGSAD